MTRNNRNEKISLRKEKITISILFLAPVFILLGVFFFYSIFYSFRTSLYNWNGIKVPKFVGLANWKQLFNDTAFWKATVNNLKLIIVSVGVELPLGLVLALFLDNHGKKVNIFKVLWFLPFLMSSAAIGVLFSYLVNNYTGPISGMLKSWFEIKMPSLLGNSKYAFWTVGFAVVWQFVPYYMIYYLAGLSSIPVEMYEAAVMDGATRTQYTFKCAIPMLMPTITNAIVLQLIGSLKSFDLFYVMTMGVSNTELMATYMYKQTFQMTRMGYGSAIASAMFVIITSIALITVRILRKVGDNT